MEARPPVDVLDREHGWSLESSHAVTATPRACTSSCPPSPPPKPWSSSALTDCALTFQSASCLVVVPHS